MVYHASRQVGISTKSLFLTETDTETYIYFVSKNYES